MSNADQDIPTPRRNDLSRMTETEVAIFDAQQALEQMGAHPVLTAAGHLLERARTMVADYVDNNTALDIGVYDATDNLSLDKPWCDDSTADDYL